jgi:uncharacterized protein (TIGR02246 family)
MNRKLGVCLAAVVLAAGGVALSGRTQGPPPVAGDKGREADREAILKSSREFEAAFNKGDAKAVAAQWTENGECHEADGELIRGRAAIEAAFADFFKAHPKARVEVLVQAVRFPAADLAVEEGLLRLVRGDKELPATTAYAATHVREGGRWLTAVSREWGAGADRLEDLDWLVGEWKAGFDGRSVTLTFARDPKKPFLLGTFTRKEPNKPEASGTFRVGLDPESGRLRSWHFDDDGGHGQAYWLRDGNRWVLDSVGVTGDGTPTAAVNVINRVNADEITWRSIDRVAGGEPLPDTVPVRLARAKPGK